MTTSSTTENSQLEDAGRDESTSADVDPMTEANIRRQKRMEIISHFGTIDFDESYDYKAARKSKRTS